MAWPWRASSARPATRASRRARYAGTEASYFLLQILYTFEKQYPEAGLIAADLHSRYPDNPLFHRYAGRTAAALGLVIPSGWRIFRASRRDRP